MSVHGEYGRALEALMICLQRLDTAAGSRWATGLAQTRSSQSPDLSTAAKACMRVLDSIDAERSLSSPTPPGPDLDPLREPFMHLQAHCRAVLGMAESPTDD